MRRFEDGEPKTVKGIVISNSCDVDSANQRAVPANILFAPLLSLQKYEALLRQHKSAGAVTSIVEQIRAQRVTNLLYLPPAVGSTAEFVVSLDSVSNQPLAAFLSEERVPLFTLNQYGFYVFLLKLSIHFTRMGEAVARGF